jgi:hypothetical protein
MRQYASPMSVDLSGEITAIATVVLAVFAIITAYYARKAFLKQSQEVSDQAGVLALQAAELSESLKERKREAAERRRAQASHIFISAEPSPEVSDPIDSFLVRIENTSQQPIYHLIFFWRDGTGEWNEPPAPPGHPALTTLLGAGAVFRDADGVHWRQRSDGQLDEEPVTPARTTP